MAKYSRIMINAINSVWPDLKTDPQFGVDFTYHDFSAMSYCASAGAEVETFHETSGIQGVLIENPVTEMETAAGSRIQAETAVFMFETDLVPTLSMAGILRDRVTFNSKTFNVLKAEQYVGTLMYMELVR